MSASELRNAAGDPAGSAASSCATSRRAAAAVTRAWSIEDLRRIARRRLPRAVFDFYDGGAEDEATLRANRAAFERVRLAPRTLVDVTRVDTSTALLGGRSALPIAIGPTGAPGFGWPLGDIGIARAAAAAGIPYTLDHGDRVDRAHRARGAGAAMVPGLRVQDARDYDGADRARAPLRLRGAHD